ncbi:unnamed protein product [Hyaloperonospora brassicae]|uniref:RxLR effector candidate protein n=1 Tax=Hyaloperonospora brassicae TaxID=162125 RepID=A0AAV0U731_HYABA|nr:unnamed protein product [Hyaloperonospora brassicae]
MSRAAGLRNWRGEIIPSVASAAPSGVACGTRGTSEDLLRNVVASKGAQPVANETVSTVEDQRSLPTIVVQKDEFGRDVQVVVEKCKRDKERKHKRKRSDKRGRKSGRDRSSVDRSRSSSRRRRRGSTPPPPDPFRPEVPWIDD